MTLYSDQVTAVLAVAAGYDNRRPGELNTSAWMDAAHKGRWTFEEAVEAVKEHYATETDFVMPAHVTRIIRQHRNRAKAEELQRQLIESPRNVKSFRHLWEGAIGESKALSAERKRLVLAHPDLAAALTEPPIDMQSPLEWSGWLPVERDQYGDPNTSPRAMALARVVAEAYRRAREANQIS
jgi:hypothetical protein